MFKVKSPFLFLLISILLVIVPTPREMDAESNDNIELQESASTDSIECNKQEGTEDDDLKDEEENEKKCPEKANSYETMKDDTASSIKQESSEQNTEEPGEFEEPIQSEDKNQEVINKESDEPNEPEREVEKTDSSEEQTKEKQPNSSIEQAEEKDSNGNPDVEENEEESKEKDGLDYEQVAPQQGLIDVGLLTDVELTANHTIENGQDHISLKLTGQAVLTLGVLQSTYVIFQLPPEITNVVKEESLEATYDVPRLLGIGRRTGEFSKSDIKVDGNQIYINFKEILALSIGGRYEFTLDFDINTLPSSYEENYTFYGQTTSQIIIDISLIDLNKLGKATISAPDGKLSFHFIPETLVFETTELPTQRTRINRQNPNWGMEVKDTRRERSAWKIHAQAAPLTSVENTLHQLPNALIYMDEQQNKSIISSEAITVFSSEGGPDEITRVQWKENEGPLIQVGPGEAVPGEYETMITWTLVDAP